MTKTTKVELPPKPRRHRWVTEALNAGDNQLSVWPSPDDLKTEMRRNRFLETIAKIGNDPRVVDVNRHLHDQYSVVYVFELIDD